MATPTDYTERLYVSQYGVEELGLAVHVAGVLADADSDVTVTLSTEDDPPVEIFSRVADHTAPGIYSVLTSSVETMEPGYYSLRWDYVVGGIAQVYGSHIEVGFASPAYDNLSPALKDVLDSVWIRFADLFDSPMGGPNLQTYFQAHWSRGRIAQLMGIALGLINSTAQPPMSYTLDDTNAPFPVSLWGSLLSTATYIECLKHLIRSYTEQPQFQGSGAVTRLDRRDYMDRWMTVLNMETPTLKSQLDVFKIRNMGLGRPKVLASGGVYGKYGPTRYAGGLAARPRFWARFY